MFRKSTVCIPLTCFLQSLVTFATMEIVVQVNKMYFVIQNARLPQYFVIFLTKFWKSLFCIHFSENSILWKTRSAVEAFDLYMKAPNFSLVKSRMWNVSRWKWLLSFINCLKKLCLHIENHRILQRSAAGNTISEELQLHYNYYAVWYWWPPSNFFTCDWRSIKKRYYSKIL